MNLPRVLFVLVCACASHAHPPRVLPTDARAGHAPHGFDPTRACGAWEEATSEDPRARRHDGFPELDSHASCYTHVRYHDEIPEADPIVDGCGYPTDQAVAHFADEAARYEKVAAGDLTDVPVELSCTLTKERRTAAAAQNARTFRSLNRRGVVSQYPYAAISAFGYGHPGHAISPLASYLPGDSCPALSKEGLDLFGANVVRAGRAVSAFGAGVAPVITFSGGAIHSPVVEAFMLTWIAACRLSVPLDRILVDPCADHTHTNVRNTARLITALGGRAAYVVTDDGAQAAYLQEWTFFDAVGGSIDQRSLREWGYLSASWRQASIGNRSGFWFTPYRFWADPTLHDFACVAKQ